MKKIILLGSLALAATSCAEKKTRIWIEPPPGYDVTEKNSRKLYYTTEDIHTGKKENMIIPIDQASENLVVENRQKSSEKDDSFSTVTKADDQLVNGGAPAAGSLNLAPPTISYLRGLKDIEDLYQKQQFTEALVRITPLIEQYPQQARLFAMQGTLYKRIGEKKLALRAYKRAQSADRSNPDYVEAAMKLESELGGSI